jgi:para-aminobenzoate synthetase component 1
MPNWTKLATESFYIRNQSKWFLKSLEYLCTHFKYVIAYHNNGYESGFKPKILASNQVFNLKLEDLSKLRPTKNTGICINYDLKNSIEKLESKNHKSFNFNELTVLEADIALEFSFAGLEIRSNKIKAERIFESIENQKVKFQSFDHPEFKSNTSKAEYLSNVSRIKKHIEEGDIYEMCYCLEFLDENYFLEKPHQLYFNLCQKSPKPYSSFLKMDDQFLISASPELFVETKNGKIFSKPIKGTASRSEDLSLDTELKLKLETSQKDRSENLMIVDLVRNDLAKICETGTVKVDEMFGIYSYPTVHQMISTISGDLLQNIDLEQIIKATFPMGSMTGAPKIKAMQLIDQYENFQRGIYSGSIGYFDGQDFCFNVVIRSIQYNSSSQTIGYQVGSAITFESDPEKEYEECMLKSQAVLQSFTQK